MIRITAPRGVILLGLATLLVGCSDKSAAEDAVREVLIDPDSAKFGELHFNAKTGNGCLEVNSKNSLGGYTGMQQAYVSKTDSGWEVHGVADIPLVSCKRIHADVFD